MTLETLKEVVAKREVGKRRFFLIIPAPNPHSCGGSSCSRGSLDLLSLLLHFCTISQVQINSRKGTSQNSEEGGERGERPWG